MGLLELTVGKSREQNRMVVIGMLWNVGTHLNMTKIHTNFTYIEKFWRQNILIYNHGVCGINNKHVSLKSDTLQYNQDIMNQGLFLFN